VFQTVLCFSEYIVQNYKGIGYGKLDFLKQIMGKDIPYIEENVCLSFEKETTSVAELAIILKHADGYENVNIENQL
jgi:hypothetical protein